MSNEGAKKGRAQKVHRRQIEQSLRPEHQIFSYWIGAGRMPDHWPAFFKLLLLSGQRWSDVIQSQRRDVELGRRQWNLGTPPIPVPIVGAMHTLLETVLADPDSEGSDDSLFRSRCGSQLEATAVVLAVRSLRSKMADVCATRFPESSVATWKIYEIRRLMLKWVLNNFDQPVGNIILGHEPVDPWDSYPRGIDVRTHVLEEWGKVVMSVVDPTTSETAKATLFNLARPETASDLRAAHATNFAKKASNFHRGFLEEHELVCCWIEAAKAPPPWGPLFKVLLLSGLAEEDVLKARRADIDLDSGVWKLYGPPSTIDHAGNPMAMPLGRRLRAVLESLEAARTDDSPLLFASIDGRPIAPRVARMALARLLKSSERTCRCRYGDRAIEKWSTGDIRQTIRNHLRAMSGGDRADVILDVPRSAKLMRGEEVVTPSLSAMREGIEAWEDALLSMVARVYDGETP